MGIFSGIGVTRNEFLDAYEYDGKYYENYDDIPFATKRAYDTGAKLVGDTVKTITDKPGIGHLLKGAAWVAGKGFQYIDREAGGAYSTLLGLADQGMTKAADAVEYHTGLYSPTAKLGGELAIDYALSGGIGKTAKTAKVLASKADNLATKAAKTLFPTPQLAFEAIPTEGLLSWGSRNAADASFNPSMMYAVTGTKALTKSLNRRTGSEVLGGQNTEARIWYQKLQQQVQGPNRTVSKASTHHMNQLMQQAKAIAEHPNGDAILKALRDKGIPMGDDITNYTSILDFNPKHLKIARIEAAQELYPNIPRRTWDDVFGGSEFSKQPLLKPDEIADRELWQNVKKETGLTNPYGEFKPGSSQGPFPEIKLYDKNNKLVRTWKAETLEQWEGRYNVINEHYGSNIDPKKLSKIKIDPELATYAPDHDFLHNEILNKLPSHIQLKELTKSGKWASLPESEAIALLEKVSNDSIRASHKVSKFRYGKIS